MVSEICPAIYNVYKPKGLSSFSVVSLLKKKFPIKKNLRIGHFGTLDPFAEGVLLVGVYGATRLNQFIQQGLSKTYVARGFFGKNTLTGDLQGKCIGEFESDYLKKYTLQDFKNLLERKFIGHYLQSPPAFSAAKFQGKKLYKHALEGSFINKPPVKREIFNLEILSFDFPYLTFKAVVSSGTYIRTLFEDMAKELGTIGHLVELNRIAIGDIPIHKSLNLESFDIKQGMSVCAVYPLPSIYLGSLENFKFCCGNFSNLITALNGHVWVYEESSLKLLGMGMVSEGKLSPIWVLTKNAVS